MSVEAGPLATGADVYRRHYSSAGFRRKVLAAARRAGRGLLQSALELWYAAQAPETPAWARTVVYGALGYFICVVDAVPDITPGVGFSDDLGVLLAALATVASHVTPEVRRQADETLRRWLGPREAS